MTLRQYLTLHGISEQAFARQLGLSQAAVNRYCKGRVPAATPLKAIIRATHGAVTANDFFNTQPTDSNASAPRAGGPGDPHVVAPDTTARPIFSPPAKTGVTP